MSTSNSYENVKAMLVGCGRAGTVLHHGAFAAHGVKYVAVVDTDETVAKTTAERLNIPSYYTDFGEALSNHDVDFVDITTPPSQHVKLIAQAFESGRNVFVEKPMTETPDEADVVGDAMVKSGMKLGLAHNHRYIHGIKQARKMVDSGAIGDVIGINHNWLFQADTNRMVTEGHWAHDFPGGMLLEGNPHSLYIARDFLGSLKLINSHGKKTSSNYPHMRFDEITSSYQGERGYANIRYSLNMTKPIMKGGFVGGSLLGTKGVITYDYGGAQLVGPRTNSAPLINVRKILSKLKAVARRAKNAIPVKRSAVASGAGLNTGAANGFRELTAKYLAYIHDDGPPPNTFEEAREVVQLNYETGLAVEKTHGTTPTSVDG